VPSPQETQTGYRRIPQLRLEPKVPRSALSSGLERALLLFAEGGATVAGVAVAARCCLLRWLFASLRTWEESADSAAELELLQFAGSDGGGTDAKGAGAARCSGAWDSGERARRDGSAGTCDESTLAL
jgi:hypothetical protein